jgi:predicted metalloprotease
MRWDEGHESRDVIDRRGERGGGFGGGGIGGGLISMLLPFLLRSPFGWLILLVLLGVSVFGGRLGLFGSEDAERAGEVAQGQAGPRPDDKKAQFVAFVLDDTQNTWREQFRAMGKTYSNAKLVLFTDRTQTACGAGQSATGPFYCPTDERVYIDLGFYDELARRFGAKGDFAQAYVIAHEIGHHVQNQLGISDRVHAASRSAQTGETGLSVRLELQADCFAGIWAHSTQQRNLLDPGDIEEALGAAAAIGDDRLQRQSSGVVRPESWTHGSSEQRSRWFRKGYETGSLQACDTFRQGVL